MDQFQNPTNVVTFASWLLALVLDANQSLAVPAVSESEDLLELADFLTFDDVPVFDAVSFMENTLHSFRLTFSSYALPEEVSFWVKPRSTAWFSRFLVEQYDSGRWISMFRMTKEAVFNLAELVRPEVERRDTNYRLAVPVVVRVACTLFKLTHGVNLTICSEMFAIGRSTVCKVLREVVNAINDTLKHEISWPTGDRMRDTQAKFCRLCSLPAVVGAIDGVHFPINKPQIGPADYFYFKTGGYSINCQAVVDSDKRFLDLYVGMPGSMNDSRMLRRSSLHYLASHGNLMDASFSVAGHTPYLLGDLGYPLLPWLMVPHRGGPQLSVSEALFNKKLRKARCVAENAFGILKHSFRELMVKSELHLTFLPDVVVSCAILHNLLLKQSHEDVENFLRILRLEGLLADVDEDQFAAFEGARPMHEEMFNQLGSEKRSQLGVYLTTQRRAVDSGRPVGALSTET